MTDTALTPVTRRLTLEGGTTGLVGTFGGSDAVAVGDALLSVQLGGRLHFMYPGTMTQSEARETLLHLTDVLDSRLQCHLIIESAPPEVIPAVLPQLRDMVEYEMRMWQVQHEIQGPGIRERRVRLPISS